MDETKHDYNIIPLVHYAATTTNTVYSKIYLLSNNFNL